MFIVLLILFIRVLFIFHLLLIFGSLIFSIKKLIDIFFYNLFNQMVQNRIKTFFIEAFLIL